MLKNATNDNVWRWSSRVKRAVSSSRRSTHDKMWSGHFLSKNIWSHTTKPLFPSMFQMCWKENKCITKTILSAKALSHLFPLSVPIPTPPAPLHSYSTTKYSSRWLEFNNSRSWWGHSWRANTDTVSSICLWMGNNYPIPPPPPDTSSWQRRGHKVTKRNKAKVDLAVDTATKGFRSMRFNICAIFKSNAVFPSSHLTGHCPNTFEALTTFLNVLLLCIKSVVVNMTKQ